MDNKKRIFRRLLVLLMTACFFAQTVFPVTAAAASYKAVSDSSGGIRVTKNGKTVTKIQVSGGYVSTQIAVSGQNIYFVVSSRTSRSNGNPYCYLYRKNISTGKVSRLKSLSGSYYGYDIETISGGSIYITGWNPSDNTACYRYYISSGKLSKVVSAGYGAQYKNYIVCESTKTHGSWVTYPIYVYNTKTGKKTCVTKSAAAYTLNGKYLYYATTGDYLNSGAITYTIRRYDVTTGKKSTIAKNIKAYHINKITPTYLYYADYKYPKTTYYRCTLKTKRVVTMSKSSYLSKTK
ncbi:MAG: hypothetical protein SOX32_02380 [Candidatus Choladocola sp.]|nr:hypothetical protein [Candidatus Choladocola sp.]